MIEVFQVQFLEEVLGFLDGVEDKAREKILFNIDKAKSQRNSTLFKKLTDDIWEFITLYNKKQYRLLAFWDKKGGKVTVVVATHGFVKKTQKTPKKEIKKAEELMASYLKNK